MINTNQFGEQLKKLGFTFYSGVPCSFLKDLINYAINECDYVMAANEGDAVAICSGAALGGKKSVVLMQNSGLTNAVSPLTSLNYIFRLPVLGFVSLRGEPGIPDEPQHELMGTITYQMLEMMKIPWEYLSGDAEEASKQLERANQTINKNQTFFFVVKKDTFEKVSLKEQKLVNTENKVKIAKQPENQLPFRFNVLEKLNHLKDKNTIQLATTGKTGRELYEIEDAPNNLYMVGSLGCISSLGLGLALARPDKDIIAIDGDGSLLMRMGSLPTNAYYSPKNLLHILIDNNAHDSTGGQATISHNINFVEIAASSGYKVSIMVDGLDEFEKAYTDWKKNKQLTFIHIKVAKGTPKEPGRPKVKPFEVKERLIQFINAKN
jgi:phosphonopyruvate decarboxylase